MEVLGRRVTSSDLPFKKALLAMWRIDWECGRWRSGGREAGEEAIVLIQVVKRSEQIEDRLGR